MELIRSFSGKLTVELSEIECEEIVRTATKKENVNVIKTEIESFGIYLGFLGEYFRLKIDSVVNGETLSSQFFMKSLPLNDLKQRKMLIDTGIFHKEVKLYGILIPRLSKFTEKRERWCSEGFFFRRDLLVLEDMSLKGYKMLPTCQDLSREHVELVLKSLAAFHCTSIVYENNSLRDGRKSISEEFGEILFETSVADIPWFHAGLKVMFSISEDTKPNTLVCTLFQAIYDIALHKTKFGKTHYELIQKSFFQKCFGIIEIMESSPHDVIKVLTHRDIWKNNLMFKNDNKEKPMHCVLLDFQTARYLPISVDVVMACICGSGRKISDELYRFYISLYYELLSENLKKFDIDLSSKMPFERYSESCDYHKTFALVYNVIVLMITRIPRDYFVGVTDDEFRDFADGNRSRFILDFMTKDSSYSELLVEAVEAAIELIYNCLDKTASI